LKLSPKARTPKKRKKVVVGAGFRGQRLGWQPGATETTAKVMMTGANGTFVYYYYLPCSLFFGSFALMESMEVFP